MNRPRVIDEELRRQVAGLRGQGLTHRQVGERLRVSERSVRRAAAEPAKPNSRPRGRAPRRGELLREPLAIRLPPGSPAFEVEIDYDLDLAPQVFMVTPNARDVETICAARCFSDEACARSYCADLIEAARAGFFVFVTERDGDAALHVRGCPGLLASEDCPALCSVEGREVRWDRWDMGWLGPQVLEEIKRLSSGPRCSLCGFPHT